MTEAQAIELISATFAAAWPVAAPDVLLVLENEAVPSADRFVMLVVTMTTSRQTTQGPKRTRRVQRNGWIQGKTWSPANEGRAGAAALADAVRRVFEQVDLPSPVPGDEPVTTFAGVTQTIGTDGRWYLQLVRIPFWYVETV